MRHNDKGLILTTTSAPFQKLSEKIIGEASAQVAKKVFKEKWNDELAKFKEHCPNLAEKFGEKATHLYFKGLDGQQRIVPFVNYRPITLPGVTGGSNNWGTPDISLVEEMFIPEHAEKMASWKSLNMKMAAGTKFLGEWLEHFEEPEQLPFSLPQLTPILRLIDFRRRHRWGQDKPMFFPQKRPRTVVPPTMELKQYVTEAALLLESTKEIKL